MRKQSELRLGLERKLAGYLTAASGGHKSVLKDLLAWAVPAGAVGLSVLGGAEVALANTIVYTPANIPLSRMCFFTTECGGGSAGRYLLTLAFDVNHDGVNDFELSGYSHFSPDTHRGFLFAGNGVAAGAKDALALSKGVRIGYGPNFGGGLMVSGITYLLP